MKDRVECLFKMWKSRKSKKISEGKRGRGERRGKEGEMATGEDNGEGRGGGGRDGKKERSVQEECG